MISAIFKIMWLRLWRDKGALVLAFILPGFIFAIFAAIFSNAGQVCVAGSRLYVEASVYDQVVEGVANNLPLIPAYGEAEVIISAKPDLLAGLNLVSGLLADPYSEIDYEFRAEIDFGTFIPMIELKRVGVLSLP